MILDNLNQIRYRIRLAAARTGRDPDKVTLVAVTKYAKAEEVRDLIGAGLVGELGESRVQDAQAKQEALGPDAKKVRWRLIGHLQTNKAKKALQVFDAIDSLDSERLAEAVERGLAQDGRRMAALVQVKLSDKATQFGVAPEDLEGELAKLGAYPHLEVNGLMAIAPELEAVEATRPHFQRMRRLFDRFFKEKPGAQLSMGMSRDFEIAVEEGATMIRVGSDIFVP